MYNYPCKKCKNFGQCMPMMNMPMMNMPMMNMPMENMSMMNMPMMNMPMCEDEEESDEDLKNMYPKIYIKIYPMVKHHCDMIVAKHGKKYCPSKEEMDCICKEISDKYKEHYRSEEEAEVVDNYRDDDDSLRQRRRYGSGGGIGDIARILIIGSLLGGRRYNYGY